MVLSEPPEIADELFQYRVGVSKELGGFLSAMHFGMAYTDRSKSLTPDEFFVSPPGGATEVAIPTGALLRPTDLDYLGLGPIVSYDVRDLIADGTLILDPNTSNDVPAKAYGITEKLMTAYLQLDIEQEMGVGVLTGNVGVQAINTEQNSTGVAFADIDGDGAADRVDLSLGDNYWDVLPSANLSLRTDSGWVFRVAASRQIQVIAGGPTDILGQAPQVIQSWRDKMDEFGHPHAHLDPPMSKAIYVAPTMEEAERDPIGLEDFSSRILSSTGRLGTPVGLPVDSNGNFPKGYEHWAGRQNDRNRRDDPGHAGLPPLRGTPDVVIERLKATQDAGINHIFGAFGFPGLPHEKVMRSIELFAKEVMPHFREAPVT